MSRLVKLFLILCALAFIYIGLATFHNPVAALAPVEITPLTVSAFNELRASYGGLQIGIGLLLLAGALLPSLTRPALLAQALMVGGLAAGRLVSIGLDGLPNGFVLMLLALESTIALLSAVFLVWGKDPARKAPQSRT